jgi:amino acid adenylation domain-containing protein
LTPEQLLAHAESHGVRLIAEGGRLRVSAPRGALGEELKSAIASAKDALLSLLERRAAAPASIARVDRAGPLPLSAFQERLWILQRLDPHDTSYNVAIVWKPSIPVEAQRLRACIRSLLERHEILRSSFQEVRGALAMIPLSADCVPVELRDLSGLAEGEQRARILQMASHEAHQPFDLTAAPAVRFVLCRLSEGDAAMILIAHHIATDDWSIGLIERELAAECEGAAPAPPSIQYADYAAWERGNRATGAAASGLEWWSRYLDHAPHLSIFPPDLPGTERPEGATHACVWDAELATGLRALVRRERATLYMAAVAACAAVLRWHTAQEDFVLGSPQGIRERTELERLVGPFVSLLLMRIDASGNPTFAELLRRVRDTMLEAHAHRDVSFEALIERLKPPRNLRHSPLFQIAIVQHNAEGGGRDVKVSGGAMHELTWFLRDGPAGLECAFEYRADLYSAEAIERIAAHLERVLRGAVEDDSRRLTELSSLPDAERRRIVHEFNDTARPMSQEPFIRLFERRAAASPDVPAIIHHGTALTYGELDRLSSELAHRLIALGVARGVLVGLCVERSPLLIVALLAIQKAGGAYVPLDPDFPAERLRFMVCDCGASVLVRSRGVADSIELPPGVAVVELSNEDLGKESAGRQGARAKRIEGVAEPAAAIRPEDPAYVIYTSGSTGRPKGVAISHGSLGNLLLSMAREPGIASTDVLAAVTTISFDIAGLELYLPLLAGARIELVSRETAADGAALARKLAACGATVLQATPATWRLLVEADWRPSRAFRALCGGEPLPGDLAQELLGRVTELWNLYGPTETTIWSTVERVTRGEPITIGRPIANTRVYIVGTAGELLPVGVAGEICIGGAGVAIGYHRREELTAERFVADRFSEGAAGRLYRTGDLGRWRTDGRIEHLGRIDQQVKIRGFRIELGEIEAVLSAMPAVRKAVVMARETGPGDSRLVAYAALRTGEDLTASDIRRHLRRYLPDYMVPGLVVLLDEVPLTPNGKVDKSALPDPFRHTSATAEYVAPRTSMERLIAGIWGDVLKIDRVGAHDNFFELGGHSLLSLRVVAAVESQSGWRMDPRMLFFLTLGQIAAAGAAAGEERYQRA